MHGVQVGLDQRVVGLGRELGGWSTLAACGAIFSSASWRTDSRSASCSGDRAKGGCTSGMLPIVGEAAARAYPGPVNAGPVNPALPTTGELLSPTGQELLERLRGEDVTPERALVLSEELRGRYPADLVARR